MTLVGHAVLLPLAMWLLVPWISASVGGVAGYVVILALYWLVFCLPVIALHSWPHRGTALVATAIARDQRWVPWALAAQVAIVAAVTLSGAWSQLGLPAIGLALLVAVVNGPLEEMAWRGSFLARFADRPRLGLWLGWVLFSLWHLPLVLTRGIVFDGGGATLVGGAAALGLLWSFVAFRTGSVVWTSLAHALTNVFAFSALFAQNGVH